MTLPIAARHLEAEIAAWPLWSEVAFRQSFLVLERTEEGRMGQETQRLTDALMQHLRPRSRGLSLELLRQLQENVWFGPSTPNTLSMARAVRLEPLLGGLATRSLRSYGGRFSIRDDAPLPDGGTPNLRDGTRRLEHQVEDWRWLSLAMPPDLLIAAHLATAGGPEPLFDYVSLGSEHLAHFFREQGIAQTHLHMGAAVPFELLWTNLMTRVATDAFEASGLESSAGTPYGSGAEYLGWLVTAALARLSLASFLWQVGEGDFQRFVGDLAAREGEPRTHLEALTMLVQGRQPVPHARLKPVQRRLARPSDRPPRNLQEVREADPLYRWLGRVDGALPETLFLSRCLRWLRTRWEQAQRQRAPRLPAGDTLFERLFWQYLRIRNRTYRYLVQEPGTSGLDWFSVHFRRIRGLRHGLESAVQMESALALESRGPTTLASLEVRTSPPRGAGEVRRLVLDVSRAEAPRDSLPERGLVLHFIKEQTPLRGRPHADPRSVGSRFGSYFRERRQEVQAIETALRRHPELLVILRGMDVCNLELSVPTWVFAPLFERLRRSSEAAANALAPHGSDIPPFQFTMHVGEDFRRLAEGLRHIDEPIHYRLLQPGDRLGHAVALGMDPERWANAFPITRQPAEERLDDLLWEMDLYRNSRIPVNPTRLESVRRQIGELASRIYDQGETLTLDALLEARDLRHSPAQLARLGYPRLGMRASPSPRPGSSLSILSDYLSRFEVYSRGQRSVEVVVDTLEIQMLRDAQNHLRNLVAQRAMTVEVNPSSNTLIGDFPLEQHPVFSLHAPPGLRSTEGGSVRVCLGDDDPVTFASCLTDEFCHLYHALIRRGLGNSEVLNWLAQVRQDGMRARFTLPRLSVTPPRRPRGARPTAP